MSKERKCILILGNGFDLKHELPTEYADFLGFAHRYLLAVDFCGNSDEFRKMHLDVWSGNKQLKDNLLEMFERRKSIGSSSETLQSDAEHELNPSKDHFYELLDNNIWFKYFLSLYSRSLTGGDWVDFEEEIYHIVEALYNSSESEKADCERFKSYLIKKRETDKRLECFWKACNCAGIDMSAESFKSLKLFEEFLYKQLQNFTDAFNIYLCRIISGIDIGEKRIKRLGKEKEDQEKEDQDNILPDYILSFNYTQTYKRYFRDDEVKVCHIHGKAFYINENDKNGLVLGAKAIKSDGGEKGLSSFFKSTQRFLKETDRRYFEWLEELESRNTSGINTTVSDKKDMISRPGVYDVWVCGHSLGIADKDILGDILSSDKSFVHIFLYKPEERESLTTKLIEMISRATFDKKANEGKIEMVEY